MLFHQFVIFLSIKPLITKKNYDILDKQEKTQII